MTEQTPSEFDFNGQDEDDEASAAALDVESRTANRKWFGGSRKRRTTTSPAGPLSRVKVPRRAAGEASGPTASTRRKYTRRSQATRPHSQRKAVLNALPRTYAEEEDPDLEDEEMLNDDDLERTVRAEDDEDPETDDNEDQQDDEDDGSLCQRCGQCIKPTRPGNKSDRYDYQCHDEKCSMEELYKRLPAPPDCKLFYSVYTLLSFQLPH